MICLTPFGHFNTSNIFYFKVKLAKLDLCQALQSQEKSNVVIKFVYGKVLPA